MTFRLARNLLPHWEKPCLLVSGLSFLALTSAAQLNRPYTVPESRPIALPSALCKTPKLPEYTRSAQTPGGGTVYTLPELIDRAEKQNPDAKGAWEAVQRAAALAGIARSSLFPTLAFSAMALRGNTLFGLPPNVSSAAVIRLNSNILQATLELSYSGDFGTNLYSYRAERHSLAAQRASLNQTNQKVALDTSSDYYDYISAKETRRQAVANEEDSCLALKESEIELKNGLTDIISFQAAKAKYMQARASTLQAVGKEANAKVALAAMLGLPPQQSFDVAPLADAPPVHFLEQSVEEMQQHALATNPQIANDNETIASDHDLVKSARRKYLPTFTITAEGSGTDSTSNTGISTPDLAAQAASTNVKGKTYLYEGSVKWNLFDGGLVRNSVKAAKANERQAQDTAEKDRLQVQQDVAKDYNTVLYDIENRDAAVEALQAGVEVWDAAKIARLNGLASDLDVSKANLIYISAQSSYAQARATLMKDATQLAYDMGDLLSTGAESPERFQVKQ